MKNYHSVRCHFSVFAIAFVLLFIGAAKGQGGAPASITISGPADNSKVNQMGESVQFQSTVSIPTDDKPVLFIKDPLGSWWPYLTAKATSNDRRSWSVGVVQFGESRDSGLEFKLQVVVLPEDVLDNGVAIEGIQIYIESGESLKPKEMRKLKSRYSTVSNFVKVTRN